MIETILARSYDATMAFTAIFGIAVFFGWILACIDEAELAQATQAQRLVSQRLRQRRRRPYYFDEDDTRDTEGFH